jgi:hypothetical protein
LLDQLKARDENAEHVVVWDGAGFHPDRSTHVRVPQGVHLIALPPYSPELNPIEKLWDIVQDRLCNQVFPTLEALEEKLTEGLKPYWQDPGRVWSLLGGGYLMDSANGAHLRLGAFLGMGPFGRIFQKGLGAAADA